MDNKGTNNELEIACTNICAALIKAYFDNHGFQSIHIVNKISSLKGEKLYSKP